MSRIGVQPITVPAGVDVTVEPGMVHVRGPKGELSQHVNPDMVITRDNGTITVSRPADERVYRQLHGLTRTLIANMVTGVTAGYRKDLEIQGVGYRAAMEGKTLVLNVGYSHPVRVDPPDGIQFVVEGNNRIGVIGIDKQLVGDPSRTRARASATPASACAARRARRARSASSTCFVIVPRPAAVACWRTG
jgi:large subunit ribosomal protein L6